MGRVSTELGTYSVVDNFLDSVEYQVIDFILHNLPWYLQDTQCKTDSPYLAHTFYSEDHVSDKLDSVGMFKDKLLAERWLNVRANLYMGGTNQMHRDIFSDKDHKTAIYYHNDNNGGLNICGDFVSCKRNRVVLLDSTVEHQGVHDFKKMLINFNYDISSHT